MKTWILALALLTPVLLLHPQDRSQARSMVIATGGIAATEHPLASQAAATVLAEGGNAIDAAIAANAMISVLEPMMCGPGGDLFAIVYEAKTGKIHGLNASGWAPRGLTAQFLLNSGHTNMPQSGVHSITVPGAVDGWNELNKRFGRKKLSQLLAPAIACAENGFPVAELAAAYWKPSERKLSGQEEASRIFLPNGHAPEVGQIFRNPHLAATYRQISSQGRDAFYRGTIAQRILTLSSEMKGTMNAADLSEFHAEWVDPIFTNYRGWTVYEIPPNGQGIAALMMLNLMEQFPLSDLGFLTADTLHIMVESKKLAYADLLEFVADPHNSRIPVKGMLDKAYAKKRSGLIDMNHAMEGPEPGKPFNPGEDTTYLCVVDREGNMISLIQSIYSAFGSGLSPRDTGFILHNRGGLFTLKSGHANQLEGRKRPLHTIIPAMMSKDGKRIAFGIMGGFNQAQAHAQFVSDIVDHGQNLQAALEAPRFTKLTFAGRDVKLENRIPATVRDALAAKGHIIQLLGTYSSDVGGGQAVMRDYNARVNYGASDPRKDGAAIPELRK